MQLSKLTIKNRRNQEFEIPVEGGWLYQLLDIQGLGPTQAMLSSSSVINRDGKKHQKGKRDVRSIIIRLGLPYVPGASPMFVRDQFYRSIMTNTDVTLEFELKITGGQTFYRTISGWVESIEPNIFTKDPELVLTVLCPDPAFYVPGLVTSTVYPAGSISYQNFNYTGTVEAGALFKIHIDRDYTGTFNWYHSRNAEMSDSIEGSVGSQITRFSLLSEPYLSGDEIWLSTFPGNKYILRRRGTTNTSLLHRLSTATSSWFPLYPGVNRFNFSNTGSNFLVTAEYYVRYGGL